MADGDTIHDASAKPRIQFAKHHTQMVCELAARVDRLERAVERAVSVPPVSVPPVSVSAASSSPLSRPQLTDVLEINVGGVVFATQRRTLCAVDDSMLASMFSGRWEATATRDARGRPFLDYNPDLFCILLDALRVIVNGPARNVSLDVSLPHRESFESMITYLGLHDVVWCCPPQTIAPGPSYIVSASGQVATKLANGMSTLVACDASIGNGVFRWTVSTGKGKNYLIGIAKTCKVTAVGTDIAGTGLYSVKDCIMWTSKCGAFQPVVPGQEATVCNAPHSRVQCTLDFMTRTLTIQAATSNNAAHTTVRKDIDTSVCWTPCFVLLEKDDWIRLEDVRQCS